MLGKFKKCLLLFSLAYSSLVVGYYQSFLEFARKTNLCTFQCIIQIVIDLLLYQCMPCITCDLLPAHQHQTMHPPCCIGSQPGMECVKLLRYVWRLNEVFQVLLANMNLHLSFLVVLFFGKPLSFLPLVTSACFCLLLKNIMKSDKIVLFCFVYVVGM